MENCGLGIIHWCSLDWQSASTLIAGFAAVAAAVFIGSMQTKILKYQAEISRKQIDIESAKLRADLFEKRLETYHATVEFLLNISDLPEDDEANIKIITAFNIKMRESEFLFENQKVYKDLMKFWEWGNDVRYKRRAVNSSIKHDQKISKEYEKELINLPITIELELAKLSDTFRSDLSIFQK